VAAGAGKVFVAARDRVVVADSAGAVTGAITGLPNAVGSRSARTAAASTWR
jgi:hypothetical protein